MKLYKNEQHFGKTWENLGNHLDSPVLDKKASAVYTVALRRGIAQKTPWRLAGLSRDAHGGKARHSGSALRVTA